MSQSSTLPTVLMLAALAGGGYLLLRKGAAGAEGARVAAGVDAALGRADDAATLPSRVSATPPNGPTVSPGVTTDRVAPGAFGGYSYDDATANQQAAMDTTPASLAANPAAAHDTPEQLQATADFISQHPEYADYYAARGIL